MKKKDKLSDKQIKAIQLLAEGETMTNTAKVVGVNRKTIYSWKKKEIFKSELDKAMLEMGQNVDLEIATNIKPIVDKLLDIALHSKNDKTALDACIYAINRIAGTPINKVQHVKEDKEVLTWDIVEVEHTDDKDKIIDEDDIKKIMDNKDR